MTASLKEVLRQRRLRTLEWRRLDVRRWTWCEHRRRHRWRRHGRRHRRRHRHGCLDRRRHGRLDRRRHGRLSRHLRQLDFEGGGRIEFSGGEVRSNHGDENADERDDDGDREEPSVQEPERTFFREPTDDDVFPCQTCRDTECGDNQIDESDGYFRGERSRFLDIFGDDIIDLREY